MKRTVALILLFGLLVLVVGCSTPAPDSDERGASVPPPTTDDAASQPGDVGQFEDARSIVYVQRDTDGTDDGLTHLIDAMAAEGESLYRTDAIPDGLIASDDVVILFINAQWPERGGTNVDLIASMVEAILAHPDTFTGEIVITDNGQGKGSLDWDNPNSANRDLSTQAVIDRTHAAGVRISGVLLDTFTNNQVAEFSAGDGMDGYVVMETKNPETGQVVTYPKFTTAFGTPLSLRYGVWNAQAKTYDASHVKLINMPVLKSHGTYRATAAIKNYMGMPSLTLSSGRGGSSHAAIATGGMGELMAQTQFPTLDVLDMIYIGARSGPVVSYNDAVTYRAIAASTDPFALDYWAVTNVLIPEATTVNNPAVAEMDPNATTPGSFGYWMNLSLDSARASFVERWAIPDQATQRDDGRGPQTRDPRGFIFGSEGVRVVEQ